MEEKFFRYFFTGEKVLFYRRNGTFLQEKKYFFTGEHGTFLQENFYYN